MSRSLAISRMDRPNFRQRTISRMSNTSFLPPAIPRSPFQLPMAEVERIDRARIRAKGRRGGTPNPQTGGTPNLQRGGTPIPQTGGKPTPQTGGTPIPQTGGTLNPQTGGTPIPHMAGHYRVLTDTVDRIRTQELLISSNPNFI